MIEEIVEFVDIKAMNQPMMNGWRDESMNA